MHKSYSNSPFILIQWSHLLNINENSEIHLGKLKGQISQLLLLSSNMSYEKWCQGKERERMAETIYHPWVHCVWPYFLALHPRIIMASAALLNECRHATFCAINQLWEERSRRGMGEKQEWNDGLNRLFSPFWVLFSLQKYRNRLKFEP